MKYLVTGVAGFIGFHLCKTILSQGDEVVGIDNINDYYDINLKLGRLESLGINEKAINWNIELSSSKYSNFRFIRANLEDKELIIDIFNKENFEIVVNLAAQAGVRYSIENPYAYIQSNINGFINVLEGCRHNHIKHLVYASSSSVYGLNGKVPFSEHDSIAHPVSLYAATKKSNELMAHSYSHLFNLPTTGLRFFTVYGPWGRPDMSPFLFTKAILNNEPIKVFNNGEMFRDFTFIDDIITGIIKAIKYPPKKNEYWDNIEANPAESSAPYKIYNIGNSQPIKLMDFIETLEDTIGKKAEKIFLPMQLGDVHQTYADTSLIEFNLDYRPNADIKYGIQKTIEWYRSFYNI